MEKNSRIIISLLVMTIITVATVMAGGVEDKRNIVPTFHKGFSAGLRPAPTQCATDILVSLDSKDFNRQAREACERLNPRKNFCVDYCMTKATRALKAKKELILKEVPQAACLNPAKKVYATPEDCLNERLKHCSVNCVKNKGRDQTVCSRTAQIECRRMGGNPFVPMPK